MDYDTKANIALALSVAALIVSLIRLAILMN